MQYNENQQLNKETEFYKDIEAMYKDNKEKYDAMMK